MIIKTKTLVILMPAIISLVLAFVFFLTRSRSPKQFAIDSNLVDKSYLLISPIAYGPSPQGQKRTIYLTDLFGKPVHTWHTPYLPFTAQLMPNGNLLVLAFKQFMMGDDEFPLRDPTILELGWDSTVLWQFTNDQLHHDFALLPNGNVAVTVREKIPKGFAQPDVMYADRIVEINKNGSAVWTWHAYEHLNKNTDAIDVYNTRTEWSHINSVAFLAKNPIDQTEGYLLSLKQISKAIIVRKSDGAILWKSPDGLLDAQHDASLLPNGHILVFDNGSFYPGKSGHPKLGSRVVEIDPMTNTIIWSWSNGTLPFHLIQFESRFAGGVQRLSNGNTMIVDGIRGHMFEITPQKKLVWNFMNPYQSGDTDTNLWPSFMVFKAKRYGPTDIQWPEKLPPPVRLW